MSKSRDWIKINGKFQWVEKEVKPVPVAPAVPEQKPLKPVVEKPIAYQKRLKPVVEKRKVINQIKPVKKYNPKDRKLISFYIDKKIHQKLKKVCDNKRSLGFKVAVSDLINIAIINSLEK